MKADLRGEPLFESVSQYFLSVTQPGLACVTDANDVAASADGRFIAITGTYLAELAGTPAQRLALIDARNGTLRIAGTVNDDSSPRFAPSDARLAFLSDRIQSGVARLYVLDALSGDVEQHAAKVLDPIEAFAWSPDGVTILLQTAGTGADKAGAHGSGTLRVDAQAPAWMPEIEESVPPNAWRRLWLYDPQERSEAPLATGGFTVWESAWRGNDEILAVVSNDPREGGWYASRLVGIKRNGAVRELYQPAYEIGLPAGSPDGRYAAIVEASCSDRTVVAGDVLLFDREAGDRPVRISLPADVTALGFRNASTLYFTGIADTLTIAGEYDIPSATVSLHWQSSGSALRRYPAVVPLDGRAYATVAHAYDRPPALVRILDGSETVIYDLAHAGSAMVTRVAGTLEAVRWTGRDGLPIGGYLTRPEYGGPYPLVVMVHGGPTWAYANSWQMYYRLAPLLVSHGYAVLHPNPRGSSGRGQAFARTVRGDMNGEDTFDIIRGVEHLIERGVTQRGAVAVTGGSYGGMMSAWIITQTDLFAAAIPVSPVTDNISQHFTSNIPAFDDLFFKARPSDPGGKHFARSPVLHADRVTTPALTIAGGRDRCTPPGQALEFHRALVEAGVKSELAIYPNEGHGVRDYDATIDYCTRVLLWLQTYVTIQFRDAVSTR